MEDVFLDGVTYSAICREQQAARSSCQALTKNRDFRSCGSAAAIRRLTITWADLPKHKEIEAGSSFQVKAGIANSVIMFEGQVESDVTA